MDGLRRHRGRLIAIENLKLFALGTEHNFDDDIELLPLRGIRVRGDNNLLIIQNAREGNYSLRKS